jgi:hypothetical protein
MHSNDSLSLELCALADHLHGRRTEILEAWSRAAQQDPKITAATTLTRAQFHVCAMSESVSQYAHLQRAEATARLRTLEDAHRHLANLERQRAEAWREATHDLRGNLSIVQNAASALQIKASAAPPLAMSAGKSVPSMQRKRWPTCARRRKPWPPSTVSI